MRSRLMLLAHIREGEEQMSPQERGQQDHRRLCRRKSNSSTARCSFWCPVSTPALIHNSAGLLSNEIAG